MKECAHCGKPVERSERALYCSPSCAKVAYAKRAEGRRREAMTKAEKLVVAGVVAPILRAKKPRRVFLVNAAGETVRESTETAAHTGDALIAASL